MSNFLSKQISVVIAIILLLLLAGGGYGFWYLYAQNTDLEEKNTNLESELKTTKESLAKTNQDKDNLSSALEAKTGEVGILREQVESVTGTVGNLVKLNQTDKELLQKYSKVYFLNEYYVPSNLANIDQNYLFDKKNTLMQFHANAYPFLKRMIDDAAEDGINLQIISAYRSFAEQLVLKSSYKITYGSGANQFSADQGYSEHQLGTTVDLTTPSVGGTFLSFEKSEAYKWMMNNAYKYGFVISYPKNNKFYQYEPWHWRFVGVSFAKYLHNENETFYGIEQREIDSYLISIFD